MEQDTISGVEIERCETVALVEAAGVVIALVDRDLEMLDTPPRGFGTHGADQIAADAAIAAFGPDVQLVEQRHKAREIFNRSSFR